MRAKVSPKWRSETQDDKNCPVGNIFQLKVSVKLPIKSFLLQNIHIWWWRTLKTSISKWIHPSFSFFKNDLGSKLHSTFLWKMFRIRKIANIAFAFYIDSCSPCLMFSCILHSPWVHFLATGNLCRFV